MSDRRISDVATVVMGYSPPAATYNRRGNGTPLLNGPTDFGPRSPVPMLWTNDPKRMCSAGDILFCVRGSTTGRMNRADRAYALGRGIAAIRGSSSDGTEFIYHALSDAIDRLLTLTSGSVFPNLGRDDLESFRLSWPDDRARKRAVRLLGALDFELENVRTRRSEINNLLTTIYEQWFIEGEGPDTLITEIENTRWGTMDELVTLERRMVDPRLAPQTIFAHYSIPAFDARHAPIREPGANIRSAKLGVPPDSVLVSKINPRIPRVWLPANTENAACSTEFLVSRARRGVPTSFVYTTVISEGFTGPFATLVTGTSGSHQRVMADDYLKVEVPIPTPVAAAAFNHFAGPMVELLRHLENEHECLLTALADLRRDLVRPADAKSR